MPTAGSTTSPRISSGDTGRYELVPSGIPKRIPLFSLRHDRQGRVEGLKEK
jgi:hypothetical protein